MDIIINLFFSVNQIL